MNRAHSLELRKSARGVFPQRLHRLAIRLRRLPLDLREHDTPEPGLPFQHPQGIAGLHALELPRIPAEHDPGTLLPRELHDGRHLPRRDHARFVDDQHALAQARLGLRIDEQPLNRHRVGKPHLVKFVHGAPSGP